MSVVSTVVATHAASLSVLELEAAELGALAPAGVLLTDPSQDRLYLRLRRDWEEIAPEEADVLSNLEFDLTSKATEMGASRLLGYLEETLSNVVRIGERREVMVEDFDRALGRLYREHVPSTVQRFVTHLPRYSLAVAAGKFLENNEVSEEGWLEAPPGLKLTPEMFVARIAGRSMEPVIPDGSLCVFRSGVTGSREGRLVLVESLGRGANDRYTVKRYHSEKSQGHGGDWADAAWTHPIWTHQRIRLEPLNPEFEAWDLDPNAEDSLRVIAEFLRVLD
jgi:SOS-response transcriptional repressor LexA